MNASHAHCANTLINVRLNEADSSLQYSSTLILLTWSIGWAPNNANRWQMGFNLAFKGLICTPLTFHVFVYCHELIMIVIFIRFLFSD
jgi:hypothetical protein